MAPKWLFWPAPAGGGTDFTPDAVNWTDGFTNGSGVASSIEQITGIDAPINLEVSWSVISGTPDNYYNIGGGSISMSTNPFTFAVTNSQNVQFELYSTGGPTSADFTVRNASDGNVILDTFNLTAQDS
jgi:hypothetical protein